MRGILGWSIQYRLIVVVVAGLLIFAGVRQAREMAVDVLPEFAPPYVEVQIEAIGLNTSEVESLVTLNLEEMLNGVPWVKSLRSKTVPGMAAVSLYFEPGTDLLNARQLVQERLLLAHLLPNVSKPPQILQPLSATSRVMMVGLSSKNLSDVELGVLARWKIRPTLMAAPGVANVVMWGHRDRQLQVLVEPERLRALGISLDQVISTAGNAVWVSPLSWLQGSTPGSGGWVEGPQQRLEVRHRLPISNPVDMRGLSVERTVNTTLGDAAELVQSYPPIIGDALLPNGSGILLVVEKFPSANTLEVTKSVDGLLTAMRPGLPGVEIDANVFRPAGFIEMALTNLTRTAILGALLLILAFFVFLRDWRFVVIGAVAIPLSLLASLFVLHQRGVTANVMVLGGLLIALGVIIDDVIGDVHNIARRIAEERNRGVEGSVMAGIRDAASEVRGPIMFGTLMVLVAALPFLFLEGVNGTLLQPLVFSYLFAVLASLIVALTVTPALTVLLLGSTPLDGREGPVVRRIAPLYQKALKSSLASPRVNIVAAVVVLAGLVALPFLGQQPLLPSFKEQQLLVQWDGAPGTSHPAMLRITNQAASELRAIPGVRTVSAHVGRAILGDQPVGINSAQFWVGIDPAADYAATVAAVGSTLNGYPGLTASVQTSTQQAVKKVLTGSTDDVVVRIFGPELPVLRAKAEEVRQAISRVEGIADLRVEDQIEEAQISVSVDLEKAQLYGLKPGDDRRATSTLVNGLEVGTLFESQKVFEVVVRGTPETRATLTNLRELLIDTPRGSHVRVGDVADIRLAPGPNSINRESISRRIDVSFNTRGRDAGAVANEVQVALQKVQFPLEYHAEVLGEFVERQGTQQRVAIAGVAAIIGIFLLLQAAFQSWRLATVAIVLLPLSLAGGVLVAFLLNSGGVLSIASFLGLLAVLAIGVRNVIVTIRHYQRLQEEGEPLAQALVIRGASDRLAPVLGTAVAIALALLPFAVFGGMPGLEVVGPMAVVILGGLVTLTWLNLFLLPAAYLRFGGSSRPGPSLVPEAVA
jgi:CzcA family heavy metal efflux pump